MTSDTHTQAELDFIEEHEDDLTAEFIKIVLIVARDWGADDPQTVLDEYVGEFESDADFAQEECEALGYDLGNHKGFHPAYYIDWEWCARDLMMDYHEEQGHYFRSV